MTAGDKATSIRLLDFQSPQMRAYHMAWFAFFLCFFAWFGIAPLMPVVRDELHLTKDQIGWCIIGSVSITIFARLFIGWLCDRIGPRLAYTGLLLLGSIPVMAIGFANDFASFLLFRVAIGMIGASFVVTQFHTSVMFAPNCVGTANATAAGWGNLGGGVTQIVMPLVYGGLVTTLGLTTAHAWRTSMLVAGAVCFLTGIAYYFLTQDTPQGNFADLKAKGLLARKPAAQGSFRAASRDRRVWVLFVAYACCFGLELTLDNVAALYFVDYFPELRTGDSLAAMKTAGIVAGLFGSMNLFARALGGWIGDRFGNRWGLDGRARWLFLVLFCEGLALLMFSQARTLAVGVPMLMLLGLFVKMSNGATYAVAPFLNREALGSVTGIVGAGGNVGAVLAGFLFKTSAITWPTALFLLGLVVTCSSFVIVAVPFAQRRTADDEVPAPAAGALAPAQG